MSLSLPLRRRIYDRLSPVLGEEETDALLAQFPARLGDEPVTRDALDATAAELRTETAELRTETAELRTEMAELRADMARFEAMVADRLRAQTVMMMTTMVAGFGLTIASNLVG